MQSAEFEDGSTIDTSGVFVAIGVAGALYFSATTGNAFSYGIEFAGGKANDETSDSVSE